jgi:hypothetical protein
MLQQVCAVQQVDQPKGRHQARHAFHKDVPDRHALTGIVQQIRANHRDDDGEDPSDHPALTIVQ